MQFMRGKARICVATVAFGMGIDKADVEGIIHLNISSSPEHYLQEIGRAGRDGRQARAISFPTLEEIPVRHSLMHSNFIAKSQIKSLLFAMRKIVLENNSQHGRCSLNIALPVERLMVECDLKVETIETLLSILEQDGGDNPLLHVEGFNYDSATVAMKKRTIDKLAEKEPVAACIKRVGVCCEQPIGAEREDTPWSRRPDALTFQRHFLAYSKGSYAFSVAKCANALGPEAESRHVFAALRRLQSTGELELSLDTSVKGRVFMLTTLVNGLEFFCAEDFDRKADDLTSVLHESFTSSSTSGARKVLDINFILNDIYQTQGDKGEPIVLRPGRSTLRFQELMSRYFGQGLPHDKGGQTNLPDSFSTVRRRELENDLHAILRDLPVLITQAPDESDHSPVLGDSKFPDYTAVTATKFFHGLDSPRAPSKAFQSHPLFGKWRQAQFCVILGAVVELLKHPAGNSAKEYNGSK
jgi:ATP-dependent DNA helicase Q4